ncbi:MAG: type VI secretion system-associated protein TagF [Rhodospirillaceae bacterium]
MPGVVLTDPEPGRVRTGYFGKLPARRDFVTANLPRVVTETWLGWVEDGLVRSRELIGEDWLGCYLNQPVWRFALSGGLCGAGAVAGVMVPNLDRVGRHFPLTIMALLPADTAPAVIAVALAEWYRAAEVLALSSLEAGFLFEDFERRVEALVLEFPAVIPMAKPSETAWMSISGQANGWQWASDAQGDPARVFAGLFDQAVARSVTSYSLWWSVGSDVIPPALTAHRGLPGANAFTALVDGRWEQRGWDFAPGFRFDDTEPALS